MVMLWLRTLIIWVAVCCAVRLMGKRQLGELQPSELVTTILISNLASVPIESPDIPLLACMLPVLLIVCLEVLVAAACARHRKLEVLFSGSPQILIQNGKIDQKMMNRLRFSVDDLLAALRLKEVFDLSQVELCMVETNGAVSVCKTAEASPLTCGQAQPEQMGSAPMLAVWIHGVAQPNAIQACGISDTWCKSRMKKEKILPEDVLVMLCGSDKRYSIIQKEEKR